MIVVRSPKIYIHIVSLDRDGQSCNGGWGGVKGRHDPKRGKEG